jgi:polysaccharide export outer membrane protein
LIRQGLVIYDTVVTVLQISSKFQGFPNMSSFPQLSFRALFSAASVFSLLSLGACALPMGSDIDAPDFIDASQPVLLSSGDKVKLTVYGEEDLSGEYMLDQRGVLTLPMIGEIPARGLTQAQLKGFIKDTFVQSGFLSRPLVSVDVASLRQIYVLGEVQSPGAYPYEPSLTGLKAVALSGGYTPRAAEGRLLVDRVEDGGRIVRMNAGDITPILPGDTIIIRERIF